MLEIKEVIRLWLSGTAKKQIARQVGLDPKTVRRYIGVAEQCGLSPAEGPAALSEEQLGAVMLALNGGGGRPRGASWGRCVEQHDRIEKWLSNGVRLSKVRRLLQRNGITIPYATLHRYAVAELEFGRTAATVAIADGEPGQELQVDTGWVGSLEPDANGRRRRFRAWIFTPVVSRLRFVYPCFKETTESAIEACEAAWAFYGGVFHVLLPDNTKAIVQDADPLGARLTPAFLEYAQARGFHVDPARVRHPKDKARVERGVRSTKEDGFGGERLVDIHAARRRALDWCRHEYGMRRHSTTQRRPLEHFMSEEQPKLLAAPGRPYDVPLWSEPKVARDHYAQVARALYSLPTRFIGQRLKARADRFTVRFYERNVLVKSHPRKPPGGRATDTEDFPADKRAYAMRDIAFLKRQAHGHGEAVGRFAEALLDDPLPWTRMRRVYALFGLVRKYGEERLGQACTTALEADMIDVRRLKRMLEKATPPEPESPARRMPPPRHLRPAEQYALIPATSNHPQEDDSP
jgi:transposase